MLPGALRASGGGPSAPSAPILLAGTGGDVISPRPETLIDEPLVRSLLAAEHPDLLGLPLVRLDAGWDNAVWRLGPSLAVRLPQRRAADHLARNEQRWLPVLAPRLPLPVPVPLRVGQPTVAYPHPWSIVPWLEGVPGDRAPLTQPFDAAERLGRFLRALHQPAPDEAPYNPYRSASLAERADTLTGRLDSLGSSLGRVTSLDRPSARRAITALWERSVAAEPAPARTWLHGDLHPANVVIAGGTLAAVIDFGDLCHGDPATDLAAAWMLLPAPTVDTCLLAYGGGSRIDDALVWRSLGWTLLHALMLVEIGLDDKPTYETVGRAALSRALTYARRL